MCPFEGSSIVDAGACTFSITASYCILSFSTSTPDTAHNLCLIRFCLKARFSLSSTNDSRMFFVVGKHHCNYFPPGWISHRYRVRDQSRIFSGEQKCNVSFPAWYSGVELPAARAKGLVCYWCKWDSQLSGVGNHTSHLENICIMWDMQHILTQDVDVTLYQEKQHYQVDHEFSYSVIMKFPIDKPL